MERAAGYIILYSVFYLLTVFVLPHMTGFIGFILLAFCGIMTRFLPGIMAGTYLMQTTTVSEFSSAMSRMHITDKLTIPLSVMFRFFQRLRMNSGQSMMRCVCGIFASAGKMSIK